MTSTNKHCIKCNQTKLISEFNKLKSAKDGLKSYCRVCTIAKQSSERKEDPVSHKARRKKWIQENPERHKDATLKRKFGISLEQFNELLLQQNNKCAICNSDRSKLRRELAVDHCHSTGKVRGLLCDFCNTGLGSFKDNKEILINAIKYLE